VTSGTGRVVVRAVAWALGAMLLVAGCGGSPVEDGSPPGLPPYGLRGQVVDSAGNPVPDAAVQLISASDGALVTETRSHADGWFGFLVFDGAYRLEVTAAGYKVTPPGLAATVAGRDVDLPRFLAVPLP